MPKKRRRRKPYSPDQPRISVVMPAYNAEKYIAESIESILNQTYRRFELFIVDDRSTDSTWKIIQKYRDANPGKIRAFRFKQNQGAGGDKAGAYAFVHARAEFVARMDADDIAAPERLEKQIQYLTQHKDVAVLGSCAYVIDKRGEIIGEKNVELTPKDIYNAYFVMHPMINPTVMVRRSAIPYGEQLYKIQYPANNDYLSFFMLLTSGRKFANLPDKLLYYRVHGKNDSLTHVKKKFINSLSIRIRAVLEMGYRAGLISILKLIAQIIIVGLLPEKWILRLYMLARGIIKPKDLVPWLKKNSKKRVKKINHTVKQYVSAKS